MISFIKCRRNIKKTEARKYLLAKCLNDKIMNSKKGSFCRMEFDIDRLKRAEKVVFC
jgi:hypothetical protein